MKTIQERLRAAAAVYNRDERPSDTYMLQAADEIDRLQAALKASEAVMSDESAKQLIASGRKRSLRMKGLSFPQAIGDGCVMGDLAALAETALADLAKMTEERDKALRDGATQAETSLHHERCAEAAESALARMKAQGTFAEGIEAAAKLFDEAAACGVTDARTNAYMIRALAPPKPAEEPQS